MNMTSKLRNRVTAAVAGLLYAVLGGLPALADDTEIYVTASASTAARSNVLFMLDTSGSMTTRDPGQSLTRIQLLKQAFADVMTATTKDINVGILEFSEEDFNRNDDDDYVKLVSEFRRLQDERQSLINDVNALDTHPGTPTTQALVEGIEWFEGGFLPDFDDGDDDYDDDDDDDRTPSPIQYSCQANYMVMMTDGRPSRGNRTEYRGQVCPVVSEAEVPGIPDARRREHARCAFQAAEHGFMGDLADGDGFDGQQNVRTSTIAFNIEDEWARILLQKIAEKGGGTAYTVSDAATLSGAFQDALDQVTTATTLSYNPPAVPVDAANRIFNSDEAYFGLFVPSETDYWTGNFKRYGLAVLNGELAIVDSQVPANPANDIPAVENGFFRDDQRSHWSLSNDGADVTAGGAAALLGTSRTTRTRLAASGNSAFVTLDENNADITNALLGLGSTPADDARRIDLLRWIRGLDVNDVDGDGNVNESRRQMGAVFHSTPNVVEYSDGVNDLNVAYVTTTEGYLHAFNTSDGSEIFAYMPEQLLGNIERLFDDATTPAGGSIPYGLDGPMTVLHKDANEDGVVNGTEQVFLYIGQRRGGNSYFAIDVTDPAAPTYKWTITGGSGAFADLGQTWSKPIPGKVRTSGGVVDALFFGGGYDTNQDIAGVARTPDTVGNAIYAVNADTGARLWHVTDVLPNPAPSASLALAEMKNSIPADLRVLNLKQDADGVNDRIYAAGTGGRVFRIDIDDAVNIDAANATSGGVVADVNNDRDIDNDGTSDGTVAGNRRFYNAPDVALITKGVEPYISIAIGSGYRAHPGAVETSDAFYVFVDRPVFGVRDFSDINDPGTITHDSAALVDASTGRVTAGSSWFIVFGSGERSLSSSSTFDNKVFFTTFTPGTAPPPADPCQAGSVGGTARFFAVDVRSAAAVLNLDGDSVLTVADRSAVLDTPGIPGSPDFVSLAGSIAEQHVLIGVESPASFLNSLINTLWLEIE